MVSGSSSGLQHTCKQRAETKETLIKLFSRQALKFMIFQKFFRDSNHVTFRTHIIAFFFCCILVVGGTYSSARAQDVISPPVPGQNAAQQADETDTNELRKLLRKKLGTQEQLATEGTQSPAAQAQQNELQTRTDLAVDAPDNSENAAQNQISPGMMLPADGNLPVVDAEMTDAELEQALRDEAFDASLTGLLPLTPDEIRRFLKAYDKTQEAVQKPPYEYPDPVLGVETLSLEPGQAPQEVNTAVGFITTVNFVDSTGEPWPIRDIGWAGEFEILQPEEEGNVVRITPLTEFAHGNMSVRLVDLKAPIVVTMKTVRDKVHYRLDLQVPQVGPRGTPPVIDTGSQLVAGNTDLITVLEGIMPSGAEKMIVTGVDSRSTAYLLNGKTYFRTPLKLLSPAWSSSVKSADGMTVYELDEAPVLLLSDNGKMVRAYVKEEEDDYEF